MAKPTESTSGKKEAQEQPAEHKKKLEAELLALEDKLSNLGKRGDVLKKDVANLNKEWEEIKDKISDDEQQASVEKPFLDFKKKVDNFQSKTYFARRLNEVESSLSSAWQSLKKEANDPNRRTELLAVEKDLREMEMAFLRSDNISERKINVLLSKVDQGDQPTSKKESEKDKPKPDKSKPKVDANLPDESDPWKTGGIETDESPPDDFLINDKKESKVKEVDTIKEAEDTLKMCEKARQNHKEQDLYFKMLKERPKLEEKFGVGKDKQYSDTGKAAHDLIEFLTVEAEKTIKKGGETVSKESDKETKDNTKEEIDKLRDLINQCNEARQKHKEQDFYYKMLKERPELKARFDIDKNKDGAYINTETAAHDLIEFLTKDAEAQIQELQSSKKEKKEEEKKPITKKEPKQLTGRRESKQLTGRREPKGLLPAHEETPKPSIEKEKIPLNFTISLVDVTDIGTSRDRDVGNRAVTDAPEKTKGVLNKIKGIFGGIGRAFTREGRRQKAIVEAKKQRRESGHLLASEGRDLVEGTAELTAIADRFSQKFDDAISQERGEVREAVEESEELKAVKESLKKLILDYAQSNANLNDEDTLKQFNAEKEEILDKLKELGGDIPKTGEMFADNLLKIIEQVRMLMDHGKKAEQMQLDFDFIIGKAKDSIRTEVEIAKGAILDRIVDKMQSNRISRSLVNEATGAAAMVAASNLDKVASGATRGGLLYGLGVAAASWTGLAVGMGFAGLYGAGREGRRWSKDREQHSREMARGDDVDDTATLRSEQESYRHETWPIATALEVMSRLETRLEANDLTEAELVEAMGFISQIEAKINLSNKKKIDLLAYSDVGKIEQENTNLLIAKNRIKVKLREIAGNDEEFNNQFKELVKLQVEGLTDIVDAKDVAFKKAKRKSALMKGVMAGTIAGVVGILFQEGWAAISDAKAGVFEQAGSNDKSATLLHHLFRDSSTPGSSISHTPDALPYVSGTHEESVGVADYANRHPGEFTNHNRLTPYGYGTTNAEGIERNELNLHFGGEKGTGLRSDGKYELDIKRMFYDRSATGEPIATGNDSDFSQFLDTGKVLDPDQITALIAEGKIKAVIILDQANDAINGGQVLEVPIQPDGTVVIDPDSLAGQGFHIGDDGQLDIDAFRVGIVHKVGVAEDGSDLVRYLARTSGPGVDNLTDTQVDISYHQPPTVTTETPPTELPYDAPIPVPIPHERRNLEGLAIDEGDEQKKSTEEKNVSGDSDQQPSEKQPDDKFDSANPLGRTRRPLSDADTDAWVATGNFGGRDSEKPSTETITSEQEDRQLIDSGEVDTDDENTKSSLRESAVSVAGSIDKVKGPANPDLAKEGDVDDLYEVVVDNYLKELSLDQRLENILKYNPEDVDEGVEQYEASARAFGISEGKIEDLFINLTLEDRQKLINRLFKRMAKEMHPDKDSPEDVVEGYKVLTVAKGVIDNYNKWHKD